MDKEVVGMPTFKGEKFEDEEITVDAGHFDNCRFVRCHLYYGGAGETELSDCTFEDCEWAFFGPAANTIEFLAALHNTGEEGRVVIEQTVRNILNQ